MKLNMNKIAFWAIIIITSFTTTQLFQSCSDSDEVIKSVDLRYRVKDSYLVESKSPEPISFLVKSTDPWEVFGKDDWYTISPSEGKPGETDTVTITVQENTSLDDRVDTIHIKSDYWIGKKFTLTQKGIAYLNVEGVDTISQIGEIQKFDVLSNQKWTAKVTDGDVWLSIVSGDTGQENGEISVIATPNSGEMRSGIITIYDRHGKIAQEVKYTQDGVLLLPKEPENEKWFAIYEEEQQLIIPVEANAKWTVEKENEIDDDWFTFEKSSFDGSDELVLNVSEHIGSSVRTAVIVLTTVAEEGATPLVKTVKFKQANPKIPVVYDVNRTITGDYYGPGELMPGRYNFYYEPFTATTINLFFIWNIQPWTELRFHIIDGKTVLSTTPWSSDVFAGNNNLKFDVDATKENVLSFDIKKVVEEDNPENAWIYTEWILNGEVIASATSNGKNSVTGFEDTYKVPFSSIAAGGNFLLRASGGNLVLKKYEYVAPLVWGE